jgi:hypothetical protein
VDVEEGEEITFPRSGEVDGDHGVDGEVYTAALSSVGFWWKKKRGWRRRLEEGKDG